MINLDEKSFIKELNGKMLVQTDQVKTTQEELLMEKHVTGWNGALSMVIKRVKELIVNKEETNVEMATPESGVVNIRFTQFILGFFRFGHEIKVSPKAHACFNKAGYKAEYYCDTVTVTIGIGRDHTAELIMTKDAWNALRDGEKVHVTTTKEWGKKFGKNHDIE